LNTAIKQITLLFITLISSGIGFAQTTDDIKKEADELFKNEQFIEATQLYLQLLNIEPRDHELNFKYGTCLLYSSQDKSEAIRFLSFSVKNPGIDSRANFYLGKAYHLNFEFNNALSYYNKYKGMASASDQRKYNIEANINACKNGRQLLTNITDMIVIEKTEVKAEDFYELYQLDHIAGSLIITDEFQTKHDKKMDHRPIIFYPKDSPYIFYSSYGEDGKTGLDIYVKHMLPNGKWSEATKVAGDVNTNQDEDYPYLSTDGKYLYYSSKGHNSMGGYDVFRSKVILEGNSFSSPENMDFAISSPDDDILYIVDSLNRIAYFSSSRESQAGKLNVYKVRVEKVPMQIAVIKGSFSNEIDPGNRELEVIVNNSITGEQVGVYNSKPGNGDILLTIPKSGQYQFVMTVGESDIAHAGEVSIPYQKTLRPLKMEFTHEYDETGLERVIVKPLFDEEFDNPTEIMSDVFQELAKLSPNAGQYNLDSLDRLRNADQVFVDAGIDVYSTPEDVQNIIEDAIEALTADNDKNKTNSLIAHNLATKKQNDAKAKIADAKSLISEAQNETDAATKNDKLTRAYKLTQQAVALNTEAGELLAAGEQIEEEIRSNQKKLTSANTALTNIKAVDQNDRESFVEFVSGHAGALAEATSKSKENIIDNLENEGNVQKKEKNEILDVISSLDAQQRALNSKKISLNETLINTKKKKDKEAIEQKIQDVESDLAVVEDEIIRNKGKLDRYESENISFIDLAKAASTIKDNENRTPENMADISNTQKLKVKYLVEDNDFKSDVTEANLVFKENDIAGEYADLAGLNESLIKARNFESKTEFEDEIARLQEDYDNSDDESEKAKILDAINQLEDLKADKFDNTVASTSITKDDLIENYDDRRAAIDKISDAEERKEKEFEINQSLSDEIKNTIKEKEKLLKDSPDDETLQSELADLKTLDESVDNEMEAYNAWKESQKSNNSNSDYTYEDALFTANPNYENRVNEIYNSSKSDQEKAVEVKTLNESTLANAEERLQEVNSILSQNTNDNQALEEKKHLTKLIDELETNKTLPLIEPQVKVDLANIVEDVDASQLIEDYNEKIGQIENAPISNYNKEKAKLQINTNLVNKINSEIGALTDAIEAKEGNTKVFKKRIENLENLKSETEEDILASENAIDEIVKENPDLANSVESIYPDYTTESHKINELSTDAEKKEAIRELNETTVEKIRDREKELKIANAANPREELAFAITELNKLATTVEKNIDQDYYGVVVLDEDGDLSKIKSNVTLYDVMPDLDDRTTEIEDEAVSKKDHEKRKIELNKEIIAKIDQNIRKLENAKNTHPENTKQLDKRIVNLEGLKSDKLSEIEASELIVGEEFIEYNIVVEIEDVNPNYINEIESISNLKDQTEQNEAIKTLNKETVQLIEGKVAVLEAELAENSSDKKSLLIEKYKQLQAEIEANPELPIAGVIETSDNLVDNGQQNPDTNATDPVQFPVIYEETTIDEIIEGYGDRIVAIKNSGKSAVEIENDKIALYDEALIKLDQEIKELETYMRIDSPNKAYAEKKIENLTEIKSAIYDEKMTSQDIVEGSQTTDETLADISDIMPDYETRKEKIEYASTSEIDKRQRTNELNNVVLYEVDKVINDLEEQYKNNPSDDIQESITNLESLKEAIETEINVNNNYIDENSTGEVAALDNTRTTNPLDPENFGDLLTEDKKTSLQNDLDNIEGLENEIEELEKKQARLGEKDAKKLDKSINKLKAEKSELQNELIIDLEPTIDLGINEELSLAKENALELKSIGQANDDIRNANEGVGIAEEKIDRAKELRFEAANTKSDIISNELLKEAAQLEFEAKELLEQSNRTYRSAIVISNMVDAEVVVMDVPADDDNKQSNQLYDLANELEREALNLEMRSSELKDSAQFVKKKYRQAIIDQAEEIDVEANELRSKIDDLRYNADELAEQEEQLESIVPENVNREVSNVDQLAVLKSNDYNDYYEEKTAADESFKNATEVSKQIEVLKSDVSKKIRAAIIQGQDVDETSLANNDDINQSLQKIDSLRRLQQQYKDEAIQHYQSAEQILNNSTEPENVKENMVAMATNKVTPQTNITLTANDIDNTVAANQTDPVNNTFIEEASTDYIPPERLNGQIFRTTTAAVYSRDKPIPVDAKQPQGLVYKVQVGAFRNPLPPEYFNKFAPISGQNLDNGVTRYMVGYFTNFVPANGAKTEIHGIGGYDDAFVVAYLNGKRISISEARAIEESGIIPGADIDNTIATDPVDNTPVNTVIDNPIDNTTQDPVNTVVDNTTDNTVQDNSTRPDNTTPTTQQFDFEPKSVAEEEAISYYTATPDAAPANQVEIISGLFYTVQVGVFSQPVPASELFNVSPLNSQLTDNGKIRYSTGIYRSIEDATIRKNELIETGLVDAFVTAYYNGERITIAESKRLLDEEGESILASGKTISETQENIPASRYNTDNVYYRILIGKYENFVPSNVANFLFNDDSIYFETELDIENYVYLYTQKFFDLNDVKKRLVEINELGFENMKIVSYYNIQIIPFGEATNILKGTQVDPLTEYEEPDGISVDDIFYEPDAIYYRIEFGTFDNAIPNAVISATGRITEYETEQETDVDGSIILHTTNIDTFVEAQELLDRVSSDIPDAKVVAFHKYVQITVNKAREIKGR